MTPMGDAYDLFFQKTGWGKKDIQTYTSWPDTMKKAKQMEMAKNLGLGQHQLQPLGMLLAGHASKNIYYGLFGGNSGAGGGAGGGPPTPPGPIPKMGALVPASTPTPGSIPGHNSTASALVVGGGTAVGSSQHKRFVRVAMNGRVWALPVDRASNYTNTEDLKQQLSDWAGDEKQMHEHDMYLIDDVHKMPPNMKYINLDTYRGNFTTIDPGYTFSANSTDLNAFRDYKQKWDYMRTQNRDFPTSLTAQPGTAVQPFTSMTQLSQDEHGNIEFLTNPTNTDNTLETLRHNKYEEADYSDIIPSVEKQKESDMVFDMFSEVAPGFGEGASNKLYLQQVNRDVKIIHGGELYSPQQWPGPLCGLTPPPWQLQPIIDKNVVTEQINKKKRKLDSLSQMIETNGVKSSNVLGDDLGYPYDVSSSGLRREQDGIFRPVIDNSMQWQHVKHPSGNHLNKNDYRREYDSRRYPRHLQTDISMSGGGTINTGRAYKKLML